MATANKTPNGKPMAICLKKRFCLSRFSSQYFMKSCSSFDSMRKITFRGGHVAPSLKIFILYPVKINILKLSPLLSQFLITNKELNLTGIGKFSLDNAGTIVFEQDASIKEDPELIKFIAENTAKMKTLVSADLDSHLELARQFLNIGKPYQFEGIGTLTKNKFGKFEFVQVNTSPEKTKEQHVEGRDTTSTTENSFTDYEEMFSPKRSKAPTGKKIVTWLIALIGLSLAVFGGYLVYSKTKNKKVIVVKEEPAPTQPQVQQDTSSKVVQTDTLSKSIPAAKSPDTVIAKGMYRFVIEKAARQRALYRYNFLKSNFIDVKMDTKDSVLFKLYFLLPSSPADTAHKRDSLQRLYSTRGRTTIELN